MKLFKLTSIYLLFLSLSAQAAVTNFPSGPLTREPIIFEYAIYLIEPLNEDPKNLSEKILKEKYSKFKITNKPDFGRLG